MNMHAQRRMRISALSLALLGATIIGSGIASAHCDTMNGPVVKAATKALETGNVSLVLVWVRAEDEAEIRGAFEKTLSVRAMGPQAKALADRYFFETLVRVHRAGEGEPYTGLKPAETVVEPGIAAADNALETGNEQHLLNELSEAVRSGIQNRFASVVSRKGYSANDINAGREYVHAYVEFIHYVEQVHQSVSATAHGRGSGAEPHDGH